MNDKVREKLEKVREAVREMSVAALTEGDRSTMLMTAMIEMAVFGGMRIIASGEAEILFECMVAAQKLGDVNIGRLIPSIEEAQAHGCEKHEVIEGSHRHVVSYDSQGEVCSEPNCELNYIREKRMMEKLLEGQKHIM